MIAGVRSRNSAIAITQSSMGNIKDIHTRQPIILTNAKEWLDLGIFGD